jgi:cytochrome c oxidase cbb3-type subunit 3
MDLRAVRSAAAVLLLAAFGCAKPDGSAQGASAPAADSASPAAPLAVRYDQHIPAGGQLPPGAAPANPYAGDARSAAEGGKLFNSMNCDGCHGGGATGWVGPSLSDGRWIYGGSDAAVFQSIYYGRPHGMPAFGGVLQPPIVWKLVSYLRSLPLPKAVPTQSW